MNTDAPLLFQRFPRLEALPRIPLVASATKLVMAPRLSEFATREIWVKHEEATNPAYGGNKVRKLQYLLGDAKSKGASTLITTGALGSHHALATAIHGAAHGFATEAFLSPQPWTEHVEENLRAHVAVGTRLHRIPHIAAAPLAMKAAAIRLRLRGERAYSIPHGGSSDVGTLGYVEAGLELAGQLDARVMMEPEAIFVALGSGATAVGLAIGLAAGGIEIPIHAVLVTNRLIGTPHYLHGLLDQTMAKLKALEPRFPSVDRAAKRMLLVNDAWLSVGYGVVNETVKRITDLALEDSIVLDPTYTAPTLATMMEVAETDGFRRALYLHTLSNADLSPLVSGTPLPDFARALSARRR